MRTYDKYYNDKLKAMHVKKMKKRDLGLAKIDSYVMMENNRRMDTKDSQLMKTDDNRASLRDLNGTRRNDYVSHYLDQLTRNVKVSPKDVYDIQSGKLDGTKYGSIGYDSSKL